jgi:hypothetical protein
VVKSSSEVLPTSAVNYGSPFNSDSLAESRGAGGNVGKATARAYKVERFRTMVPTGRGGQERAGEQAGRQEVVVMTFTVYVPRSFYCSTVENSHFQEQQIFPYEGFNVNTN